MTAYFENAYIFGTNYQIVPCHQNRLVLNFKDMFKAE